MLGEDKISMYWWEGFFGFNNVFHRIMKGLTPYVRNFGDLLSPLIISLLTQKCIQHTIGQGKLLSLGSVFFALKDNDLVWGAGLLNAKHIQYALACQKVNYLAVRGPETRNLLIQNDIECPAIYGDPAFLLPYLIRNDLDKKYRVGIVPHFSHYQSVLKAIKKDEAIKIIDVERPLNEVMNNILSCEVILSSSLHGLIVSEVYGIPSLMLAMKNPSQDDLFKYQDYFHSTDRPLFFAETDFANLISLIKLAFKQKLPHFDSAPLLNAFPFKKVKNILSQSDYCWSQMSNLVFTHSFFPPRFSVPI